MQRKMGVIAAVVITVGLIVALVLLTTTSDTEGPVITYDDAELVFDTTMEQSVLLQGVQAVDEEDGDVSDSIIIQNINYNSENGGVVVYVARDSSNNVTTSKRKFTRPDPAQQDVIPEEGGEIPPEVVPESPGEVSGEPVQPEGAAGQEYETVKQQQLSQGLPFIWLSEHEITVNVGAEFIVQNYIAEIENAGEDPYRRIQINGDRVNTARAGSYVMELFVTNDSGGSSNRETLHVTVN